MRVVPALFLIVVSATSARAQPRTRRVDVRPTGTLRIDSDAVQFAVYGRGTEEVVVNDGTLRLELGTQWRVIALYSNGVAEEIYDDIPRETSPEVADRRLAIGLASMDLSPLPATLLLLVMLGVLGVIAARTTD